MIVSSLYPRFRDMAILWSVAATVLFYATPVLYPIEAVPGTLRDVFQVNPLTPLLELGALMGDRSHPPRAGGGSRRLAGACCPPPPCTWGTCVLAVWVFRREAPRTPSSSRSKPTYRSLDLNRYSDPPEGWATSLANNAEVIVPCLGGAIGARSVAEVGAYAGDLTELLVDWAAPQWRARGGCRPLAPGSTGVPGRAARATGPGTPDQPGGAARDGA